MRRVGKNNVVVMTKTRATTAEQMKADLDRFRRELGRDHLDIVLLHCLTERGLAQADGGGDGGALARARAGHRPRPRRLLPQPGRAQDAARTPWVQVDLARINGKQASMDADPETVLSVLREMKRAGKGIIGMKIFGAGKLAGDVDGSLAFASSWTCWTPSPSASPAPARWTR
jgi:hypothetical protein